MRRMIFRAIAVVAATAALACLAKPASAANLSGRKFLQAQGATTYFARGIGNPDISGLLTLTGLIEFNAHGGAKSVAVTLNYNSPTNVNAAVLCKLNTAADVTDSFDEKSDVGTFTITIGKNDACVLTETEEPFQPDDGLNFYGRPITFDLYHGAGSARIASIASAILDGTSSVVNIVNVVGSLVPAQ